MIFGKIQEYRITTENINPYLSMTHSFMTMVDMVIDELSDQRDYGKNLAEAVNIVIQSSFEFLRIVEPLWGPLIIDIDVVNRELFLRVPE